jgi:hypothetical protein
MLRDTLPQGRVGEILDCRVLRGGICVQCAEIEMLANRPKTAWILKPNGEDVKVVREPLRHAAFQIAMDTRTQAIPQAVRSAHGKIAEQLGTGENTEDEAAGSANRPELDPRLEELAVS